MSNSRQSLTFSPSTKLMRVAHTYSGANVWIGYYLVRTGLDASDNPVSTERSYLYSNPDGTGRLSERNVELETLVPELAGNEVKKRNWRVHAYGIWRGEFGGAKWREDDEEGDEMEKEDEDEEMAEHEEYGAAVNNNQDGEEQETTQQETDEEAVMRWMTWLHDHAKSTHDPHMTLLEAWNLQRRFEDRDIPTEEIDFEATGQALRYDVLTTARVKEMILGALMKVGNVGRRDGAE